MDDSVFVLNLEPGIRPLAEKIGAFRPFRHDAFIGHRRDCLEKGSFPRPREGPTTANGQVEEPL